MGRLYLQCTLVVYMYTRKTIFNALAKGTLIKLTLFIQIHLLIIHVLSVSFITIYVGHNTLHHPIIRRQTLYSASLLFLIFLIFLFPHE